MNKNIVPVNEVQASKDIKKANPIKGYPIQVRHELRGYMLLFSLHNYMYAVVQNQPLGKRNWTSTACMTCTEHNPDQKMKNQN